MGEAGQSIQESILRCNPSSLLRRYRRIHSDVVQWLERKPWWHSVGLTFVVQLVGELTAPSHAQASEQAERNSSKNHEPEKNDQYVCIRRERHSDRPSSRYPSGHRQIA